MKNTDLIKKFSFFSGLQEEDLSKIASISAEKRYTKNMIIFIEGEKGEAFYYVKSGKIKIYRTSEDGKEHIIHLLGEGDVFGEVTLFGDHPYPATASVYEDSVVGIIKNSSLEELIRENSELALKIIKILADRLFYAQVKIKELAFNDVYSRTASQILKLAHDYGIPSEEGIIIDFTLSRQELADMVGTTRETISRAISTFKKEKSIFEIQDKIVILNKTGLSRWI